MICKMCGQNKKLIDAHIIPRCFFEQIKAGDKFLEVRSNIPNTYRSKSYIGFYDNSLVCLDCEKLFQEWDDYGCRLLLEKITEKNFIKDLNNKRIGYTKEIDYKKLKLFFISILWRADQSSRKEFSKIRTGPFERKLKEMIIDKDPGDKDTFSIYLSRFMDSFGLRAGIMSPFSRKAGGINNYVFYMGSGYKMHIKVDKRPFNYPFSGLILRPDSPLVVLIEDEFTKSKDFLAIAEFLRK